MRSVKAKMNDYIKRGDCLELMREIPDDGIDMILCDLPYGVTRNAWDKKISFDALWAEYRRIIKDDGAIVLFAQEPFTSELIQSNPKWFKYKWIWAKHSIVNFLNAKKQPLRNFEEIVVFYYKQCTYQPIMTKGKMQLKCRQGKQSANYGAYGRKPVINDVYYPRTIIDIPAQVARGGTPNTKARRAA